MSSGAIVMVGIGVPEIIIGLVCCLGVAVAAIVVFAILMARCGERSWPSTRRSADRKQSGDSGRAAV
jgi:hypothetical protein